MYFLNSTYFIFNQFKSKMVRVSFAIEYIYECICDKVVPDNRV